jgi:hypothetical protein
MREKLRRGLIIPLFVSILSFYSFLRMPGSEHVRNVQIVALLACGMGLGVALAQIKILLGMRSKEPGSSS